MNKQYVLTPEELSEMRAAISNINDCIEKLQVTYFIGEIKRNAKRVSVIIGTNSEEEA